MLSLVKQARGFTLIELLVTLAVLAVLMGIGIPNFVSYSASAKLRNAAEGFYAGVQQARAEAIRSNELVQLVLTDTIPTQANVDNLVPSPSGANWAIRAPGRAVGSRLIEARLGAEGQGSSVVVNAGAASTLSFNGLGANAAAAAVTVAFTHPTLNTACSIAEAVRCVNVVVSAGGQSRLCEPGRPLTDARSC